MTRKLTPAQSRHLALALLILTLASAVAALALPTWKLHQHYDQHIEEYADHLARFRRVAAMRPEIEAAIHEAEQRDSRKYYLKANLPTLAAAELQALVTRIVESRQGRIMSTQILPAKDEAKTPGPARIALSVQLSATMVPLQMILHTIETQEPTLFVDQLTVRANQGRGYRPVPGVQPEFYVTMTIGAYTQPAQPAQPAPPPAPGAKP